MLDKQWESMNKKVAKNCMLILCVNWGVFAELSYAIKHSLEELGLENIEILDESQFDRNKMVRDMYIVIKAFRPFTGNMLPPNSIKILYQPEECWNRRERGSYDLSGGWDRVLELYDENVKIPRGTNNVVHCPIGYSPAFETDLPEVEEDIDVLFFGSMTERRTLFRNQLAEDGYNVNFLEHVYGKERDEFIMRSKIVINIKAHDMWSYGPLHCLLSQCKKKFTLSEKGNGGYGPFVVGRHFMEYDGIDDLKKKLDYWLPRDKERKQFAEVAYNDMKENCDFTKYIKNGLRRMI